MFWLTAIAAAHASLAAAQRPTPTNDCPILGPAFPSDFDITSSTAIKEAISAFPGLVDNLFDSGVMNRSDISFAIDVFSSETNASIYSYVHSGEDLKSSLTAGVLDDGTIFRIGSVSKLYTVYAILAVAGMEIFEHPVTKYLPELAWDDIPSDRIVWNQVTVGALASQMGGTGGFLFPSILCYETQNCTEKAFLAEMRDLKRPVIPLFQTALYSDSGFGVLGRILERLTNQTYAEALQSVLAVPLGLNGTTSIVMPDKGLNAIAIPGSSVESSWGKDNQITAPSGGVYSNTHDLRALGLSILQSRLLSVDTTRHWLKPRAHTASLTTSVGAPWEINRLNLPVSPKSNCTRVSDLYTKLGGQVAYTTVFALSPDHGIGYSVLIAGANGARSVLRDLVATVFIPAAEHVAFENAALNYAGTFADPGNATSNLTLTVDADKPGLGLSSFFVDNVNWLSNITQPTLEANSNLFSFRLYPSGIEYPTSSSNGIMKTFNAVAGAAAPAPRAAVEGGIGLFDKGCQAWQSLGFFTTSEFELEVVEGRVESVRHVDANVTMRRIE